jgi:hypothetical protein
MKESNIQKKIMIAVSKYSRVFRNNVGTGWTGKISPTKDGGKYIKDARPLKAGLCVGSSDLIGWTEKTVTADMIGQKIAIFTALEIKTATGKATKEQLNFIRVVKQSGGISGIARSEIEAVEIVNN